MLDLMSHTAGFGEISFRLGQTPLEELTSLEEFLQEYMPERVYPPGQVPAYSNYGTSLAGYIVEQVSDEPYEQYVETHILQPLGMAHSTMHQPLLKELVSDMAQSYQFNGTYQPLPLDRLYATPAGALSASGVDMGKFMLAHLNDGEYNEAHILQPETARLMHTQSSTFDPAMPGRAHGYEEQIVNGWRLIRPGANNTLQRTTLLGLKVEGTWVPVRPMVLQDADTGALAIFKADEQGQVRYMRDSGSVATAVIRIEQPWYGGQVFHFGLLVFSPLTFLLTVIAAVVAFFISLRKRAAGRHSPWQERLARGLALVLCLAFIFFVAIFIQKRDDPLQLLILIMAWLIAFLSASVTIMAIVAWWKGWWGLVGRLHDTVISLAALAFTWFESYWCFLIF